MKIREFTSEDLGKLWRPNPGSHKGENGRVLVIGGSKLFHSSIFWSADVASRVVDLVHFTSPANENNEVVRKRIKEGFWTGIVVDWVEVDRYIQEDDVVLIGPGMPRNEGLMEGERSTGEVVNELLTKFPDKKWVVDGGALQEVDPGLLNGNMVITPHLGEWERLMVKSQKSKIKNQNDNLEIKMDEIRVFIREHDDVTVLLKNVGGKDVVVNSGGEYMISGGNEGLTKGGTGDVLAGLTAAMYTKNEALTAAAGASWVVKRAADRLYKRVGVYYNAGDLVQEVAGVMGKEEDKV